MTDTTGLIHTAECMQQKQLPRRPKLLFLAYYFPPVRAVASVRAWNIAKYLARMDWDVTVVAPSPSVWRNVEDADKVSSSIDREGIHKLTSGHRWRFLSPADLKCWNTGVGWIIGGLVRKLAWELGVNAGIGWVKEAEKACSHLTSQDVDVILASGPPFACFMLAKRLSTRLGRPYVLDYRDPWGSYAKGWLGSNKVRSRDEKELIGASSGVTVVSQSLLKKKVDTRSKQHVIPNGFDPEEMARVQPCHFGHFAIVYAGIFYPPKRVVTPIMAALRCLLERNSHSIEWRFHYYGGQIDHVESEAKRFGVLDRVVLHGSVPRAEALAAIGGSGVTVVITSVIEQTATLDGGIVTGKLFDALGLKVPILVIAPRGSDVESIVQTTGLARVIPAGNIKEITSFLQDLMLGIVPEKKCPEDYAWPNVIQQLQAVLHKAIDKVGQPTT